MVPNVIRILQTKIFVPRTASEVIERPLPVARLEQGRARGRRLTLVAAAAGSGKTTLVASWPCPKAWLSLDEDDNDPTRFWSYVVAAVRSVVPEVDESILGCFATAQPPVRDFLAALINERKLFISVGTVKTHMHNVSRKLAVANRTQAVARARQLGIIWRPEIKQPSRINP